MVNTGETVRYRYRARSLALGEALRDTLIDLLRDEVQDHY